MKQRGRKILALVPLNLDGYMFSDEWKSGKSAQIKSRLAADFTGWDRDDEKFDNEVDRLLTTLRADAGDVRCPRFQNCNNGLDRDNRSKLPSN
jgi:hypothetical protein